MKKERVEIPLSGIEPNIGQLDWLPRNPRQWTQGDIDKTAASIREDPDFLEDRPLLVVPKGRSFVVFAGNLRREGAIAAKLSKVPCVLYHPEAEADQETIRRRAMKDNGSFGSFDWDEIFSSPWGQMDLEAMGIGRAFEQASDDSANGGSGAGSPDDYGTDFNLPDGERAPFQQMTFTLVDVQAADVKEALRKAKASDAFKSWNFHGNDNGNGNALALIIEQWLAQKI